MKKILPIALCLSLTVSFLSLYACNDTPTIQARNENVLRIASWDEYIDEGGEDSYVENSLPLYEEFEDWYFKQTGKKIKVEYIALQDNETMYNKIKMGDSYDLLCPSEYMIMKLASEGYLQKLPESFFDTEKEENYYVKNLSPYIRDVFENGKLKDGSSWAEYSAGYMWGTTGFIFNPEHLNREEMKRWNYLLSPSCNRQITIKDNVRDSYFVGLGIYHENELLQLKSQYEKGEVSRETYKMKLSAFMNDTDSVLGVQNKLQQARKNLYGIETDEAKSEIIAGRLDASYQWSGDAVYLIDEAEAYNEKNPLLLEYSIPEAASNLWFDGWVLMNESKNVEAATAFINFLSMPQNVVRNMYYIGYTSCIGGNEVFEYIKETYGFDEENEEKPMEYDLSYFFGENSVFTVSESQTRRQLFAQYPDVKTIDRLVVMNYFDKKTNEQLNRMWNTIK